ncbi:MAG: methyltransferase domain-containing protein [Deltaproteobacteria bacterium]|nr:methyltransferase domain-containing protein [Deltaproteobacteria bacterium]
MERTPEPELMDDEAQARAYAEADFSVPHEHFVELFRERFPDLSPRTVLDLGCGPGDVSRRLARAWPLCRVVGVDGAAAMLTIGNEINRQAGLAERVELRHTYLPARPIDGGPFDAITSNSLLHHLADPATLWSTIAQHAEAATAVFVMDLLRPHSPEAARDLVDEHAAGEPDVLRRDFLQSLHAAYRPAEVRDQLARAGLDPLTVEVVSDRHLIVHGTPGDRS